MFPLWLLVPATLAAACPLPCEGVTARGAQQTGSGVEAGPEESEGGEPSRRGWSSRLQLGGAVLGTLVTSDRYGQAEPGIGAALRAGYDLTPAVGLFLQGGQTLFHGRSPDEYGAAHWDVGIRVRMARRGPLTPYLEGAYTDQTLVEEKRFYSRGHAATLGGGVILPRASRWEMDLGVTHTRGRVRETREGSNRWVPLGGASFDMSSTRFRTGMVRRM
jgi:hypothetical protein